MLEFHHIGCVVENIEENLDTYVKLYNLTARPEKIFVSSQGVNVCFVPMPGSGILELVEAAYENSVVARLRKKGITYYHTGYLVEDLDKALAALDEMNFKFLNTFHSEAFGGRRCSFLYTPELQLIELIEK